MEEYLSGLMSSISHIPLLYTFFIGIATSISPCPLASNIAAVAYLSRDVESKQKVIYSSLLYVTGRTLTYSILGAIIILAVVERRIISDFLQGTFNQILGPILLIFGIFLTNIIKIGFNSKGTKLIEWQKKIASRGLIGSFILGILFALAFCPISSVWFFIMIGIAVNVSGGITFPVIYGIGTGLPVLFFALLIVFSVNLLGKIFGKVELYEKWFRKITGVIFILIGIYITLTQTLGINI